MDLENIDFEHYFLETDNSLVIVVDPRILR